MQLLEIIVLRGIIRVKTGLHIGAAGKENIEIGGVDLPVIKNPVNQQPYIPGSSIKGKMRFLTEWRTEGDLNRYGDVHSCKEETCEICRIFGPGKNEDMIGTRGPTRLIVRDAHLHLEEDELYNPEKYLEVKYENTIDRMKGSAKNSRTIERVIPGSQFRFEIACRIFDESDYALLNTIISAMKQLEEDTLGGSGSRGCGKIAFENLEVKGSEKASVSVMESLEQFETVKEF